MRRLLAPLLISLAALAAVAPVASANPAMFSIMMDDDQLLYRGDAARDAALQRMRRLGVDYVRVTVLWSVVAENARFDRRGKRRRNFRADNPRTYPRGNWDRYDRLVRAAKVHNIGIYFNVTGPGPRWAHGKPPKRLRALRRTWKPKPREFFKFVKAVGRRYDGSYVDENDGRSALPRVSFWSIYNEPNQGGWLTPQYQRRGRQIIPWSPIMYRELWYYGRAALDSTGHANDVVLIGETAPLGSSRLNPKSPMRPKKFIRELLCVNAAGEPLTGRAYDSRKCRTLDKIRTFRFTAWAHHPYTKDIPPTQRDRHRDSITMANASEISALMDRVSANSGLVPANSAIVMSEFGYETDPPDRFSGISLARQAEYLNMGDYIAYKDPRIVGNTQFLLRDVPGIRRYRRTNKRHWFTYQSGLYFADGRAKPAANAYQLPLVVLGRGVDSVGQQGVRLWGWTRFLPPNLPARVALQFRPAGAADFSTIGDPVTVDYYGFFETVRAVPGPGTWRAVWINPVTGIPVVSRNANFEG